MNRKIKEANLKIIAILVEDLITDRSDKENIIVLQMLIKHARNAQNTLKQFLKENPNVPTR